MELTVGRPTLSIARAEEKHAPGLHHCLHTLNRELDYLAVLYAPAMESVLSWVRKAASDGRPLFVALADSRLVVGWCEITPEPYEGFRHSGTLAIGVLREYRRRGIGRRLVEACLKQSKVLGLERVELGVFASNAAAIALYESMGFVREGLKRDFRKEGNTYEDLLLMARIERSEPHL